MNTKVIFDLIKKMRLILCIPSLSSSCQHRGLCSRGPRWGEHDSWPRSGDSGGSVG